MIPQFTIWDGFNPRETKKNFDDYEHVAQNKTVRRILTIQVSNCLMFFTFANYYCKGIFKKSFSYDDVRCKIFKHFS